MSQARLSSITAGTDMGLYGPYRAQRRTAVIASDDWRPVLGGRRQTPGRYQPWRNSGSLHSPVDRRIVLGAVLLLAQRLQLAVWAWSEHRTAPRNHRRGHTRHSATTRRTSRCCLAVASQESRPQTAQSRASRYTTSLSMRTVRHPSMIARYGVRSQPSTDDAIVSPLDLVTVSPPSVNWASTGNSYLCLRR